MPIDRITVFCFGASYAVALALELIQLVWPRPVQRLLALLFAAAGLLAQTLYLAAQAPPLSSQFGSMLFLGWILAVFYLYGSIHHRRVAWGIFVLPLVLGSTLLAGFWYPRPQSPLENSSEPTTGGNLPANEQLWIGIHSGLLILAAVGICVGFVASVMYLVQAYRLKAKMLPGEGLRLLSLERLEDMNRHAIVLTFPLLTAGMLVGIALIAQLPGFHFKWTDPTIVGTALLWLVFVLVLCLRYGFRQRGRRVAWLTIVAFVLLLVSLLSFHGMVPGGGQ